MFVKKIESAIWVFILVLSLGVVGCGGGSSGSSDDDDAGTALTGVFPSDLVLVSPTAARSAAWASVNIPGLTREEGVAPFDEQTELQEILNGETVSDCAFTLALVPTYSNANCFGPQITYTNHPDTTPPTAAGTIGGGDLGIMYSTVFDSTEACSAGQMNERIDAVAEQVNSVIYAMASLPCLAGVNGLSLPAAGETLDLTTAVSSGFTSNSIAFSVTSATLARADDTADGYTVYILTLSGVATDENETEHQVNVRLKHIATATDNSTYRGKISYTLNWDETQDTQGNCPAGGATDALSISYEKTAATAMVLEMQSANFCGDADPYVSATNYTVDLSKKYDAEDEPTGWANSGNYSLFGYDPQTGAGDFIFGWQAGMTDNARILEAAVSESGGAITGCAYFGYGTTFEHGVTPGIAGMYCAWSGPRDDGESPTLQPLAERQCFSYDATTSVFIPDESVYPENITFAPTDVCSSEAGTFTYTDSTGNVSNSGGTADIDHNLLSVEDIEIGTVTPPTEVDE